jgi:hypothetical protein
LLRYPERRKEIIALTVEAMLAAQCLDAPSPDAVPSRGVMVEGELLAIWLHDDAAKLFLGIQDPQHPRSRWAVLCRVMKPTPIGIWVNVQRVEERRPATGDEPEQRVAWTVQPSQHIIRYEYIITAQRIEGAPADLPDDPRPTIGFRGID